MRLQYRQAVMDLQIEEEQKTRISAVMTEERIIMKTAPTLL